MATHLSELGAGLRCRNASGKYVPCPSGLSGGCGLGGCLGGDKMIPFNLPVIGGDVSFDVTDAVFGALGGQTLLGVTTKVLEKVTSQRTADITKATIGVASLIGLAYQPLRDNSMFVGFSFVAFPKTMEPLTDYATKGILWLVEKVSGRSLGSLGSQSMGAKKMWKVGENRRIGQDQGASGVSPSIPTSKSLFLAANAAPRGGLGSMVKSMAQRIA